MALPQPSRAARSQDKPCRLLELAPDINSAGKTPASRDFPDVTRPDAHWALGLLFDYRAGCRIHQIPDPVLPSSWRSLTHIANIENCCDWYNSTGTIGAPAA